MSCCASYERRLEQFGIARRFTVRLAPPLVVSESDLSLGLDALASVLREA